MSPPSLFRGFGEAGPTSPLRGFGETSASAATHPRLLIVVALLAGFPTSTRSPISQAQPRPVTIAEIQGAAARSPLEGQLVTTTGVVTGRKTNGFFIHGTAQALTHMLVTRPLVSYVTEFRYVRGNADAPEVWRSDARRAERVSDHDGALLYLSFLPAR